MSESQSEITESVSTKREHFLDTAEKVAEFFGRLSQDPEHLHWCAVDAEADSMHAYETKLCLLQFASGRELAVIDPLAMSPEELVPMLDYLDKVDGVWFHGADYDMTLFMKTFNRLPGNILDTQTAARLCGVPRFGLANLIEEEFGFKMSKQSQKADWGKRPLPEKMIRYAYDDVRYMLELAAIFVERLEKLDRRPWFEESCRADQDAAALREEPSNEERWRIQGWGKLSPRGLGFLREFWRWRDAEAQRMDRPPFKVLSNQLLMTLSHKAQDGEQIEAPHYLRSGSARRLIQAVARAREIPDQDLPSKKVNKGGGERLRIDEDRFEELRNQRDASAEEYGIDSTLIAPRWVLERLSARNLDQEVKDNMLLSWQRQLIFP